MTTTGGGRRTTDNCPTRRHGRHGTPAVVPFMPIYPVVCPKGHRHDQFAKVAERNSIRCPSCGAATEIDFARVNVSAGDLSPITGGRNAGVSITESVSRKHVKRLRQLMPKNGHLVGDDGKVRFRNSQDAKAWFREREDNVKKAIARKGQDPDKVIADRAAEARLTGQISE